MNLCKFVTQPHIRERMAEFRPKMPRTIDAPLRVSPRSERYTLIGTAFDYLLRFEIKRRAPHAIEGPWLASTVADGDWRTFTLMKEELRRFCESRPDFHEDELKDDTEHGVPRSSKGMTMQMVFNDPCEVYFLRTVRKVVNEAKADIAEYRVNPRPSIGEQKQAAFHAVRLAKIDPVLRAAKLEPTFERAELDDIEELLDLLRLVPWDDLLFWEPIILNPSLGSAELSMTGDADLICGGCLIDCKVTKSPIMAVAWLDQVLGYYLLVRFHSAPQNAFADTDRFGIYLARQGLLWQQQTRVWTDRPGFLEFERWFFDQMTVSRTGGIAGLPSSARCGP